MSYLLQTQSADPALPAASKNELFADSTNRRPTSLDDKGVRNVLTARALQNYLRNGGFWFAQRQAPGTLTTYSNLTGRSISADGWGITNENASVQYIRTDTSGAPETGLNGRFYGTFSKITTTGKLFVSQVIEGSDSNAIRNRTVRFQVWLKASSAKTIKVAVIQLTSAGAIDTIPATFISAVGGNGVDPTLGTNLAFLAPKTSPNTVQGDNCTAGVNAYSCSVTTVWQRFGGVVDIPNNAKNVVVMIWSDSQFVAADSVSISQASLTDGFEIQDFSPLSYETEFERVQRYFAKTFDTDVNPVQNGGSAGALKGIVGKAGATALACFLHWRYPVQLRSAAPTLTLFSPGAASAQVRRLTGAAAADQTASTTLNGAASSVDVSATGDAAGTVGDQCGVHITADAEL